MVSLGVPTVYDSEDPGPLRRARRNLPSLAALEAFDAVARIGSTIRAAEYLGRTQSAVSRQIMNLEGFVRCPLFERVQNRLVLNPAGQYLHDSVGNVLDRLEDLVSRAITIDGHSRNITLQVWPTFAAKWLAARLTSLEAANPDMEVNLKLALHRDIDFEASSVDAVILYGPQEWPGLTAHRIVGEELIAVTTSAAFEEHGPDIEAYEWLSLNRRPYGWRQWLAARHPQVSPKPEREFSVSILIEVACLGQGVAVLPSVYVEAELASGRLVAPFGPPLATEGGYYLLCPEGAEGRPELVACREWLTDRKTINH
jgi:LysR family glycine cleavage system transcriptional activator